MNATDDRDLEERANELYWSSEESVNQIADELELSKGALYGLIQPLPSGLPCPRCSATMEYPNRTARERGYLVCPQCDLEEDEEVIRSQGAEEGAWDALATEGPPAPEGTLLRMLAGAALLGAAAGVVVTLWARRR